MWFGTDKGLSRFDGKNYNNYAEKEGLSSNFIYSIFMDREKHIWAGSFGGNACELKGSKFVQYNLPGDTAKDVLAIEEDKFGRIYLLDYGALHIIANNKVYATPLKLSNPLLLKLDDGTILISDSSSVYRITPANDSRIKMTRLRFPDEIQKLFLGLIPLRAIKLSNGNIGLITRKNFIEFKLHGNSARVIRQFCGMDFTSLAEDNYGNIWITDSYRKIYEITKSGVNRYTAKDGFSDYVVSCVYKDYEGNLWFGTMGGGVLELESSRQSGIKVFNKNTGLHSNEITTVLQDSKDNIWFGTPEGIDIVTGNKIYHISSTDRSLSDIRAFAEDSSGNYYFGTFHRLYGPTSISKLIHHRHIPSIPIEGGVSSIFYYAKKGKNNNPVLWVTTYGNGEYKILKNNVYHFQLSPSHGSNMFEDIVESDSTLWFLSRNQGASKYVINKYSDSIYMDSCFTGFSLKDGLPTKAIYSLYEDKNNKIYLGTDAGLVVISGDSVRVYFAGQGITDRFVLGIIPDKNSSHPDSYWIITDRHILKFAKDKFKKDFSINILPSSNTSITRIFYDKKEDVVWAASTEGAVKINLSEIKSYPGSPRIVINSLRANDNEINLKRRSRLDLSDIQNNISIGYQALSFENRKEIRYEYKLVMDDNLQWSALVKENIIHYKNLSPGKYKFFVRAVNAAGIPSVNPAEIDFNITPPFWDTTWFMVTAGILLTGFIGGTSRYVGTIKMKKRLKDLERENEIERERARISQDLHDHIGSSLTRIDLLSELAKRNGTDETLDKISGTAKEVIRTMDEIVWVISPQNDLLNNLVDYLIQYANEFFAGSGINCRFNLPEIFPEEPVRHELRHNIFLTIKEALNNVLKHSGAGEVNLNINIEHGSLKVEITDNGKGFNTVKSGHNGNGLNNMGKRIKDLGGKYEISSTENRGTTIKFAVSLKD